MEGNVHGQIVQDPFHIYDVIPIQASLYFLVNLYPTCSLPSIYISISSKMTVGIYVNVSEARPKHLNVSLIIRSILPI